MDVWRGEQVALIAALVLRHTPPDGTVGILGLTYKPGVDITDESPGLKVAAMLARHRHGAPVVTFDPSGVTSKEHAFADTLAELVDLCATLLVATPWPDFQELQDMNLEGKTVVDLWGMFEDDELSCRYVRLGRGA